MSEQGRASIGRKGLAWLIGFGISGLAFFLIVTPSALGRDRPNWGQPAYPFGAACYAPDATTLRCTVTPMEDNGSWVYTVYPTSSEESSDSQTVDSGTVFTVTLPAAEPDWNLIVSATDESCETDCAENDVDLAGDMSGSVVIDTTGSEGGADFPTVIAGGGDPAPLYGDADGPTGDLGPTGTLGPTGAYGATGATESQDDAASGCGQYKSHFDGGHVRAVAQWGLSAHIDTHEPYLCSTASASTAWVGETKLPPRGTHEPPAIVQIGYVNAGSASNGGGPTWQTGWNVFDEIQRCFKCVPVYDYYGNPSGTKAYRVGYDSTNHRFALWYDGGQVNHTSWNPVAQWARPWKGDFLGETWDCASDVPGTSASPVVFSSISEKKSSTGTWGQISALALNGPRCSGRYQNGWVSQPASFKIYTN